MLFLQFQIGSDRYALEARQAVEVIPLVALQQGGAREEPRRGIVGVFNYRGQAVPAVDLSELTVGRRAEERLSTRIIVVKCPRPEGRVEWLGLIAEQATGLLRQEPGAGEGVTTARSLGPVMTDEQGVVQLLLPERVLAACLPPAER